MAKSTNWVEFYKDTSGEFRWRFVARNGRIMADGGEGYKRRAQAKDAFERVASIIRSRGYKTRDIEEVVAAPAVAMSPAETSPAAAPPEAKPSRAAKAKQDLVAVLRRRLDVLLPE